MTLGGVTAGIRPAPVGVLRRDRLLLLSAAAFAVAAVFVDWTRRAAGVDPQPTARRLAAACAIFLALAFVLAMLDRARRDTLRRRAIHALALAGALLFGGQAVGYVATSGAPGPFDSRVEAVSLLVSLPVVGFALVTLCWPRGMSRQEKRIAFIDSAVAVLALAIIWWQAVVPTWIDDERFGFWVHLNQLLIFLAIALTVVIAVVSRRIGSLPFVQLALLLAGMAGYLVSDFVGQVVRGLDDVTTVTYSLPGYVVAIALLVRFAHRAPVEIETLGERRARELLSVSLPLLLALAAGGLVISYAVPELDSLVPLLALATWVLLLVGVLVARMTSTYELRRAQESAVASILADRTREGWFRALVGDSNDGVLVLDAQGGVVYTSPRIDHEFDFSAVEHSARDFGDLMLEQGATDIRLLLAQSSLDPTRAGPYDMLLRGRDERPIEVEATLRPITDIEFEGFVVTVRDVSDTRRLQRQLANSRRRDELTGLLSREALLADLSTELDRDDAGLHVAVAVLDLERFGRLNDGLGHEAGDEILVAVARTFERLPEEVRAVARVGADSFALLIVGEQPDTSIAEAIDMSRDELRGLLLASGRELELTFRAGYVVVDPDAPRSAEWYLEAADLALARSTSSRYALLVAYDAEMRVETEQRLVAERQLRRALAEGRIEPFYQPVLRLSDSRCMGAEALARLRREDGTVVLPADFIDLAEEIGLIHQLGTGILERACEETAQISAMSGRPMGISVNVAVDQLEPEFVTLVAEVLARSGLAAAQLTLEVTESTLADRSSYVAEVLRDLRLLGVTVSLDDFGTGYSSMSYLATLPVDGLKIDRSFVATMGSSPEGLTLARVVVQLATSLELTTVAEGIETVEQADLLRGMGCQLGQGYLFARPMPFEDYVGFLRGPVDAGALAP